MGDRKSRHGSCLSALSTSFSCSSSPPRLWSPPLPLLLLFILLILSHNHPVDSFSWPNPLASFSQKNRECVRSVRAVAFSTCSYPANNPIEDRYIVVDDQIPSLFASASSSSLPYFHAAVFDGHGGAEVAEMVRNTLVGKVKETIAKLPRHAQKDETVVRARRRAQNALRERVIVAPVWYSVSSKVGP